MISVRDKQKTSASTHLTRHLKIIVPSTKDRVILKKANDKLVCRFKKARDVYVLPCDHQTFVIVTSKQIIHGTIAPDLKTIKKKTINFVSSVGIKRIAYSPQSPFIAVAYQGDSYQALEVFHYRGALVRQKLVSSYPRISQMYFSSPTCLTVFQESPPGSRSGMTWANYFLDPTYKLARMFSLEETRLSLQHKELGEFFPFDLERSKRMAPMLRYRMPALTSEAIANMIVEYEQPRSFVGQFDVPGLNEVAREKLEDQLGHLYACLDRYIEAPIDAEQVDNLQRHIQAIESFVALFALGNQSIESCRDEVRERYGRRCDWPFWRKSLPAIDKTLDAVCEEVNGGQYKRLLNRL